MITEQDKKETLKRILGSKTFSKSTTTNVLLKFLVEKSIQDAEITAADIGHEIFGARYEQEKSEATVRVNIYHLRKKLKRYFEEEGQNDPIAIFIETGQYKVSFKEVTNGKSGRKKPVFSIILAFFFILLLAVLFLISSKPKDRIWSSIFKNNYQNTLYLSPIYGYSGPGPGGSFIFHRDTRINSDLQLQKMLDSLNLPEDSYEPAWNNYVTFEDAATLRHFSRLFTSHRKDFAVRRATDFLISDIKDQNIIYLSPMRYHTQFRDVFNEFSTNIKLSGNIADNVYISYTGDESKTDSTWKLKSDSRTFEHAIAAKFKGSNNTNHIMFFADHGLGLTAMAEFFTNEDSIRSFSDKHLKETEEFIALFYVSGKNRTNLDLKLILLDDNK
ncbi:hypothetical protein [Carboxylicivirga caseinilyticus]|uniref:hypothetical protein n=1 Tax=Carboxylicivirga caseinilyticus TaxID=3417572 RepID=UPI003D32DA12|nr:hypothetical protein [Marinilabiliaceae bacterium A049]